jgi:hypothetical protein
MHVNMRFCAPVAGSAANHNPFIMMLRIPALALIRYYKISCTRYNVGRAAVPVEEAF